jgi:hypothetical protein
LFTTCWVRHRHHSGVLPLTTRPFRVATSNRIDVFSISIPTFLFLVRVPLPCRAIAIFPPTGFKCVHLLFRPFPMYLRLESVVRRSTSSSNCTCKRSICESSDVAVVAVAVGHVAILDAIAMIAVARWKFLPAPLVIDLASLSTLAVVVRHWWEMVWEFGKRGRCRGGCRSLAWTIPIPIPIL